MLTLLALNLKLPFAAKEIEKLIDERNEVGMAALLADFKAQAIEHHGMLDRTSWSTLEDRKCETQFSS